MPLKDLLGAFNLTVFKQIVVAAALAGVLSGVLLTLVQRVQVIPTLLKAEVYEEAAEAAKNCNCVLHRGKVQEAVAGTPGAAAATMAATAEAEHDHEHTAGHEHHHDAADWQPANGMERTLYTAAANIVIGLGFALLLGAVFALSGVPMNWRLGLLWGLAGYVVFFVAPSLGLPPEVPGTEAAQLVDRQMWWLMTALSTAVGLALLVFSRRWLLKLLGALLLGVPHFIGAPQPEVYGAAAPPELAQAFVHATFLANGIFWLSLGALLGFFYKKLA